MSVRAGKKSAREDAIITSSIVSDAKRSRCRRILETSNPGLLLAIINAAGLAGPRRSRCAPGGDGLSLRTMYTSGEARAVTGDGPEARDLAVLPVGLAGALVPGGAESQALGDVYSHGGDRPSAQERGRPPPR